jgi:uncharacterized protein (DUF58 family)
MTLVKYDNTNMEMIFVLLIGMTARYNEAHVKVFEEERELTMMLMVDISGSESFGSKSQFKKDIVTEIAATMAFLQRRIMTK